ncbi:hypothetical protein EK21DRAFT_103463 [Setomelanomma holmii]|uniref:NB-ARC domain-containing protein n=1 Tax=Setomelanomma holmii TaxID=210430 RepID=A0A9P4H324_9PLEO|nr:hypothetical protein EK21DRAFT_103463 [Setomelanomma holmii]
MQLLHFNQLKKLVLTNFCGKKIPLYAILLHSGSYKEKKDTYRKLQFCAEQAAQDKLQYFWIDTYVLVLAATETPQCSRWEASFRASAWFNQVWTLQELIAPVSVEFFSCEGRLIGNKRLLNQPVHEIKICETTKDEDVVYCLLGVLDVSMLTSYSEGRESASRRLQAEVEAANSAPSIIPLSQNSPFVGQELQLANLEAKVFSDKQSTMLAIVGPRRTGKLQLALKVAHRTRQTNKNCSVFWVDVSNKDSLYQSYASIAQKLSVLGWNGEKADVKALVKRCLANNSARQCLLIFDNAEDILLGFSGSSTAGGADLLDYLPQSELCSIIFTTISSSTARTLASQNVVELRELAPDLALRMLDNYLSTQISHSEQQEAKLFLQELSYLPLAIVQAAAYLNARSITLQNYQYELDKHKDVALKHSSGAFEQPLQGSNAESCLSLDEICRSNTLAADYLFLAACVDRKDIPLDLLDASSTRVREDAVRVLSRYALVTRRPTESALDLHGLVYSALREWLLQQGRLQKWT